MDDGARISEDVEKYLRAARGGDVTLCSDLLKAQPELLNTQDAGGYGALHFAAFNGDISMIRLLLEHKPVVDLENYDDNTPLVMAVKGRKIEAIRMLAGAGADLNKATSSGAAAIHHAAAMGYLDCFEALADLGAKVVYEGTEAGSVLHWACRCNSIDTIGTIIYKYKIPVDVCDKHGGTPLLTALFYKHVEEVEFLLEHGADANTCIVEDGTTALHIAAEHANTECVRVLCSFGADPNKKNKEGQTPIDLATKASNTNAVKELTKAQVSKEKRVEESIRYKNQGNKVFGMGENVKAAKFYTLAIHLDNTNHVYFSNRAASYFNQRNYKDAFWDAVRCITLKPDWAKGYLRKAATELAMKRYNDAVETAALGLKIEPNNKDLAQVKEEAFKQRKA